MLDDLKKNIEKLIALYENAKVENTNLRQALNESNNANESFKKRIMELERQIENLKLTEVFKSANSENQESKQEVDKLIKEIDKCINLIN